MKKALIILSCIVVAVLAFATAFLLVYERERGVSEKPVLYLYPQEEQQLTVTLDLEGSLDTVYPAPDPLRSRATAKCRTANARPSGGPRPRGR